ncbi:MAG TPA: hypothetical protein VGD43_10020 [Micromonospora sp.]
MPPNEQPRERRALELENECAGTVADRGYLVHQNPSREEIAEARRRTSDEGDPDTAPDYLVEGHVFDCYCPTSAKPVRGVWDEVAKKVRRQQTQRVLLNLHDWRGDLTGLRKQFDDWPISGLKELAAVTRDGAILQIVRRD